jgi:hypothetical protein
MTSNVDGDEASLVPSAFMGEADPERGVCIDDDEDDAQGMVWSAPDSETLKLVDQIPDWCEEQHIAGAWALSEGATRAEAAGRAGVSRRSIYNWLQRPGFKALVDALALKTGLAQKAERLKLLKRLARQVEAGGLDKSMRRHDAVDLARAIREEVESGVVPGQGPPVQVVAQYAQFWFGSKEKAAEALGIGWERAAGAAVTGGDGDGEGQE